MHVGGPIWDGDGGANCLLYIMQQQGYKCKGMLAHPFDWNAKEVADVH